MYIEANKAEGVQMVMVAERGESREKERMCVI